MHAQLPKLETGCPSGLHSRSGPGKDGRIVYSEADCCEMYEGIHLKQDRPEIPHNFVQFT